MDTAIVKIVDGFEFQLQELSETGAEQARITLTHLAEKLGYENKQGLKKLADRNASQLAQMGTIDTVSIVSGFGRITEEPTYNVEQATYLALSSETEQGRAARVGIIKAYKSLLAMFERVVNQSPAIDSSIIQLLIQQSQSNQEMQREQTRALTALTTAVLSMGTMPSRRSRERKQLDDRPQPNIVRLAEQDQTTERKIISAMIRRLAGVVSSMPSVEYGARMSTAYHAITDRLRDKFGIDINDAYIDAHNNNERVNTLDWFEQKGVLDFVKRIIEELYQEKAGK